MINVPLDKIVPVTYARDHFATIINGTKGDRFYVLARNGRPKVVIIDLNYLEKLCGQKLGASNLSSSPDFSKPKKIEPTFAEAKPVTTFKLPETEKKEEPKEIDNEFEKKIENLPPVQIKPEEIKTPTFVPASISVDLPKFDEDKPVAESEDKKLEKKPVEVSSYQPFAPYASEPPKQAAQLPTADQIPPAKDFDELEEPTKPVTQALPTFEPEPPKPATPASPFKSDSIVTVPTPPKPDIAPSTNNQMATPPSPDLSFSAPSIDKTAKPFEPANLTEPVKPLEQPKPTPATPIPPISQFSSAKPAAPPAINWSSKATPTNNPAPALPKTVAPSAGTDPNAKAQPNIDDLDIG